MRTSSNAGTRLGQIIAAVLVALALAAAPAAAQSDANKKQAKELFQKGRTQFDLGNFAEAVELFKQAYSAMPYPELLFNIAQAYRQMGDCKEALFFYKRYLALAAADAGNRELVEGHIKDLTRTCKQVEDAKNKPPLGAMTPSDEPKGPIGDGNQVGVIGDIDIDDDDDDDRSAGTIARAEPSLFTATVEIGPAFLSFGELQVSGAQPSFVIGAAHPMSFGAVGVAVGAVVSYTPVPWENENNMTGTSALTSLLANVSGRYWLRSNLAVRADLGLGGLFFSGLEDGNVFLPPGTLATGALSMFNVRVGVGVDYLLTDNIALTVSPFTYSTSSPREGFRDEVSGLSRIELTLGVGYWM